MICVSISCLDQLQPALDAGAEMLEFRLDMLGTKPEVLFDRLPAGIRTVATYRPGSVSEEERGRELLSAIRLGASLVDLELESSSSLVNLVMEEAAGKGCEVIISHHDFTGTPDHRSLGDILDQCYRRGGVIAKIATMVMGRQDLMNLLSLYGLPGRKVVLGMGELGRITRVIGPYLGAEFTFASAGEGRETAPGQLSFEQLKEIYQVINKL